MRSFSIGGDITSDTYLSFQEWHASLDAASTSHALVSINSYGGSAAPAIGIADLMLSCKTVMETVGIGIVCSAASLIFMAGSTRKMHKMCMFYDHLIGDYDISGSHSLLRTHIDVNAKWDAMIRDLYKHRTSLNEATLDKIFSTDGWACTADEALMYGICHEVIGRVAK